MIYVSACVNVFTHFPFRVLTPFCILQWLHNSHLEGTNGIKPIHSLTSNTIVHIANAEQP